nr:NB-ARC domain-containing protein [Micromonospora sp. DSM 115978]
MENQRVLPDAQGEAMFGPIVVEHRRRLNLTQEELAARTGLSARAIRQLEVGRVQAPRASSVRLLADAFGLDGRQREVFIRAAGGAAAGPSAVGVSDGRAARCLPRPATYFTGRDEALAGLVDAIDRQPHGRPLVVAMDGMAGVGKTAMALEVAYRVADRYPDGQLFVDLRGHSEQAPVERSVALGLLLEQLGVPAKEIPEPLEARIRRWRTELPGRRVLVVLDNAADSDQVRHLLPGMSTTLVLVTSRRRLVGLDADEHLTVDPLDEDAAVALLAGVIGERRLQGHIDGARAVARLCGNLPLALRLTSARLRHHPGWTVENLADRLRADRPPVVELSAEGTTVAAALTLSYRQLTEPAARLLRRLGLHGGEHFDGYAAAALDGTTTAGVQSALDELLDAHLVQPHDSERYRLHDLVQDYASRLASEVDDEPARHAAVRRMLDYYVHSLVARLPDGTFIDGMHLPDWGPPSPHRRVFSGDAERVRWQTVEWRNVVAAVQVAESYGMDRYVCLLIRAVWGFHFRRGDAGLLVRLNETALAAARRLGDLGLAAMAHNYLAGAHARAGRMRLSRHHLAEAIASWRAVGDATAVAFAQVNLAAVSMLVGQFAEAIAIGRGIDQPTAEDGASEPTRLGIAINQVLVLRLLGECHIALGQYRTALSHLRQAASLYHGLVDRGSYRFAIVLLNLGRVHARLRHRVTAPLLLRRALAVYDQLGNQTAAAEALVELGLLHLHAGELREAQRLHERALERAERGGTPQGRCLMLNRLGTTLLRLGDAASAVCHHREALAIAQRVELRYEEAVAHAGLTAALATVDPGAAAQHAEEGERLFAEMGAVGPYHLGDGSAD